MKKAISALICAAMLAAMIAVGIPTAAGATFFKTAELLELKEHIEDDAGMNEFATVQGGCTDGHYAYFAVQQANTTILKYDMKTWKLADKAEKMNSLGHANDMTYNNKLDRILVANNGPDYHILTVLDPDTLKKVGTVKLKLEVYGIAYNPEKDIYVVGISGGYQFAFLNSDFKVIKKFKGKNTGYTRQGCDCDQNYIYFSQSGGDNIVAVYDYSGKYVDSVSIGHKHEVENIFHVGSYFYTTLHHYGNSLQRIGLSNQTEIRYNVYYDPGDGVGKMKPTSVHYGHSIPLRKNTLRKDGYFFGGWRASRSMDGKYLKDVDITMEDGATSRKVRRIVEKRMCQAYHRQHKNCGQNGGRDRHYMKRATSFQLHNLGQIECETGVCRTESTHWKRSYDPITGEVVFKKKMGYSTYEEAMEAARQFSLRHPEDKRTISAYKCAYCGMWHIGHYTPDAEKTYPDMVTFLGQAS